jgi:hypothetical protein
MKREFRHPDIDHVFEIEDAVYGEDGFPIPQAIKVDGILIKREDLEYAFANMYGRFCGISQRDKDLWAAERIYVMRYKNRDAQDT